MHGISRIYLTCVRRLLHYRRVQKVEGFAPFTFSPPNRKELHAMNSLLNSAGQFLKRNSSTILTVVGATGVVATAVMAVSATPKAVKLLEKAKKEKGEDLTVLETIKTAGPVYIPSAAVGLSTIACIFGANVLNKRHQASIMSAYAFLDNSYKEYKRRVLDAFGDEAKEKLEKSSANEKAREQGIPEDEDDGKELFFDYYSMRYFRSTMADVMKAEMDFNKHYVMTGYSSLNEFYEDLGLPPVDYGNDMGWAMESIGLVYDNEWIDFEHEKVTLDCGLECWVISMSKEPNLGFLGF